MLHAFPFWAKDRALESCDIRLGTRGKRGQQRAMSGLAERATHVLREAGFLPDSGQLRLRSPSQDILPQLVQAWESSGSGGATERPRIAWLAASAKLGARLTVGAGACRLGRIGWIGERLIWWPQDLPNGRLVGVVSSRLPRRLDTEADWIAALRSVCFDLDPATDVLLCAPATTTARFVERLAVHLGLQLLVLNEPKTKSIGRWLAAMQRADPSIERVGKANGFLSPVLSRAPDENTPTPDAGGISHVVDAASTGGISSFAARLSATTRPPQAIRETPLRDRCVVALADLLIALRVRRDSQTDRLLRARLRGLPGESGQVCIAMGRHLVPSELAGEFETLGATVWNPRDRTATPARALYSRPHASKLIEDRVPSRSLSASGPSPEMLSSVVDSHRWTCPTRRITHTEGREPAEVAKIVAPPATDPWEFLTHWTRRPHGPWPDQSEEAYLDELLQQPSKANRSPLAALQRIVKQQRIIATSATLRGQRPGVCFTAVPLLDLPRLRTFRSHRGRWDFELYGICVRRSWLEQRGSQPVRYGDQHVWDALPESERPFFQRAASYSKRTKRIMAWQAEQEWRHLGDVDLSELPSTHGLIFVPSDAEAYQMAAISRWPVTVLARV